MKRLRMLCNILIVTKAYKILIGFLIFVGILAAILTLIEPEINTYGDGLWYCYVNLFTIGFGDIVPETAAGRILSVILTIYATLIIALLTGVIVAYYNKILSIRYKEEQSDIIDKLCNLENLSEKELKELSKRAKQLNEI